jgi:hypothetical protein
MLYLMKKTIIINENPKQGSASAGPERGSMKTTISIELEFEVDFDIQKEEQMTLHYPGCPAYVEPYDMKVLGVPLEDALFIAILDEYEDEIHDACWDALKEEAVAEADHRRDVLEDR